MPWFPTRIADIDTFSTKTLDAGTELEADHPGFSDIVYRERRRRIVEAASTYRCGEQIPRVEYSPEEVSTWGNVYRKLRSYTQQYAIEQYNAILPLLEQVGNTRYSAALVYHSRSHSEIHAAHLFRSHPASFFLCLCARRAVAIPRRTCLNCKTYPTFCARVPASRCGLLEGCCQPGTFSTLLPFASSSRRNTSDITRDRCIRPSQIAYTNY